MAPQHQSPMPAAISRITADDATQLACDVGPAPMQVGAVLMLDTGASFDAEAAKAVLALRITNVPRLRQRLLRLPVGLGRPIWVDDADFDIERHVSIVSCPGAGDEDAALDVASGIVTTPLPHDRPLWSATFVTGVAGGRTALVVAFHHVLADGLGGLAILANLVDGAPQGSDVAFPMPKPSTRDLAWDAVRSRLRTLKGLPGAVGAVRDAVGELRGGQGAKAVRCSLNQPTGPRRALRVVRTDLDVVRRAAHDSGGTVNDAVLAAVAGALHALLSSRGEDVDSFVISVPVSARTGADAASLGNQVGAMPIELPAVSPLPERIAEVALRTRERKRAPSGASRAILGPLFRVLARLGIFRWFVNNQHLVHTFTTNLRGPETTLAFHGATISGVYAAAVVTGNVSVSFAVLSYAGTLAITVVADPDICPDHAILVDALSRELDNIGGSRELVD